MSKLNIAIMVGIAILAILGQLREYKRFNHICATHIPNHPIAFEYGFEYTHIAGTFSAAERKIRIAIGGKMTNREQTLWHELGHASTFYIYDLNKRDIGQLINVFESNSLFDYRCSEYNWHFSYVSKYACTNVMEDIAETYAHIMSNKLNNNRNQKIKAKMLALCKLFNKYNIACLA